jgi:hypothetical protein
MTVEIIGLQRLGGGGGGSGNVVGPASAADQDIAIFNGTTGKLIADGGMTIAQVIAAAIAGSGTGNVVGPASAADDAVTRYDGTTGKLIQDSNAILPDDGALTLTLTGNNPFTVLSSQAIGGPGAGIYYENSGRRRVLIGPDGSTEWTLSDGAEVGRAYVATPSGVPGFIFLDAILTNRTDIRQVQAGNGGLAIGSIGSGGNPGVQMYFVRGLLGLGSGFPTYGFQVMSTPLLNPNQTVLIQDDTPSTGSTGIFFGAGAGQSTNPILSVDGSNSIQALGTVKGVLTTIANAVTGLTPGVLAATTDSYIQITDGTGQVYRVPCII